MNAKIGSVAIVGVFLFLYVVPLGVRPLVAPDETRYAEIPREMLASRDWIVPRLNGLRYFEKPVLGYWLNAMAISAFGENAFAVRLPSALSAGLTALILYVCARRFAGGYRAGLLTAAIYLSFFEVLAVGAYGVLDSPFSLFSTAAIVSFFCADQEERPRHRMILLGLTGVCCGLAFLTKGFVALAMLIIVIIPFTLWEGRLRSTLRTAWAPLLAASLVVLPWGIMIYRREPDFWHYFFWVEHIIRFSSPKEGQHPYPFWYYVPIVIGGAIPWTFLTGAIGAGLKHASLKEPLIRLAVCWFVLPFLFFSASGGKVATYVLPCFAPLALLVAAGLLRYIEHGHTKALWDGARIPALGCSLFFIALVVSLIVVPRSSISMGRPRWMLAALGLLVWAVCSWMIRARKGAYQRLAFYWAGPLLFMFACHFVVPALTPLKKIPGDFLRANISRVPRDGILVSNSGLAGAVCWFYKRDDVWLVGGKGEYEYGLAYEDSEHRLLSLEEFNELVARRVGGEWVTLILTASQYDEFRPQLVKPIYENIADGLAFAQFGTLRADPNASGDVVPLISAEAE